KAQSKSSAIAARRPFGFNIIGYVSGHGGLAISARNMARLLLEKGYRIATLDLDPGLGKQRHDSSLDQYAVESASDLPYQINLICTSLSRMHEFVLQHHELLLRDDYLNAAVVYWELTVLPEVFAKALKLFDVLIAPSHYVRSSLECVLSDVRTIYATYPAYIPSVEPDRKRFGLPPDAVLLAYTFDPHSDPARKNPTRLIETFRRTFSAETNVGLVIKLNTPSGDPSAFPAGVAATLRNLCAGDSRILVIAEPLTYPEVLSLYASC